MILLITNICAVIVTAIVSSVVSKRQRELYREVGDKKWEDIMYSNVVITIIIITTILIAGLAWEYVIYTHYIK